VPDKLKRASSKHGGGHESFKGPRRNFRERIRGFIGENIRLDPVNLHSSYELLSFFTVKTQDEGRPAYRECECRDAWSNSCDECARE
jgi:hypothetical protein